MAAERRRPLKDQTFCELPLHTVESRTMSALRQSQRGWKKKESGEWQNRRSTHTDLRHTCVLLHKTDLSTRAIGSIGIYSKLVFKAITSGKIFLLLFLSSASTRNVDNINTALQERKAAKKSPN